MWKLAEISSLNFQVFCALSKRIAIARVCSQDLLEIKGVPASDPMDLFARFGCQPAWWFLSKNQKAPQAGFGLCLDFF